MMIPDSYYNEQKFVKLSDAEIDLIVEQLKAAPHNLYDYLGYDRIINKLKDFLRSNEPNWTGYDEKRNT